MNKINIKHGGNIISRGPTNNSSSIQSDTGLQNSEPKQPTTRVSFMQDSGVETKKDEKDRDWWEQFWEKVEEILWNNVAQPLDTYAGCLQSHPDKPGYARAWTFFEDNPDGSFVRLAPCGCYSDALWPTVLSLGFGAIGKKVTNKVLSNLRKKCALKFMKSFSEILTVVKFELRPRWLSMKFLGIDPGSVTVNAGRIVANIQPVQPGYKRFIRLQSGSIKQASNRDLTGKGRYFYDDTDIKQLPVYAGTKFQVGTNVNFLGNHLDAPYVVYIDVPQGKYTSLRQKYWDRPLTADEIFYTATGETKQGAVLSPFFSEWFDQKTKSARKKATLIRVFRDKDGVLKTRWEYDFPNDKDRALNPELFSYSLQSAEHEYFLSIDDANSANTIRGVNELTDISEYDALAKELEEFSFIDIEYNGKKVPFPMVDINDKLPMWQAISPANRIILSGVGEQFLTDTAYRTRKIQKWNDLLLRWKTLLTEHAPGVTPEAIEPLKQVYDKLDSALAPDSPIIAGINKYVYLFSSVGALLGLVTIGTPKVCGPKNEAYSLISDAVRQIGIDLTPGYTSPIIPRISERQWDLIRNKLIQDEARVLWAELDDNCECDSCPEDYNLCNSTINFFTDYYNQCLKCQECKNSNEFDPIYAENSKVPIVLSHKSSQIYRSVPLIAVDGDGPGRDTIIDARDCVCECTNSTVVRLDKNGLPSQLIPSRRTLKEYTPQTGNIFEDYNCFGYSDADKKVDIDIAASPGGSIVSSLGVKIPPSVGRYIPGIPFETKVEGKVCDYEIAPDGLYESSIFPWQRSVYYWSPFLGRWSCKETKDCESPQVFTEGVGDNDQYCDCYTIDPTPTPTETPTEEDIYESDSESLYLP